MPDRDAARLAPCANGSPVVSQPGDQHLATRAYIADMLRDLSAMARRQGDMTLAYLIEMAELEAQAPERSSSPKPSSRS
jgi:hypothetical protein